MRRSIHFGGLNETFVYDRNRFERRRVISTNPTTGAVTSVRDPVIPLCTSSAQAMNRKAICSQGVLRVTESSANFRYTALHVKVDKRFAERYQFTGSYALSRFTGFNEVIDAITCLPEMVTSSLTGRTASPSAVCWNSRATRAVRAF